MKFKSHISHFKSVFICVHLWFLLFIPSVRAAMPMLHAKGTAVVDQSGKPLVLRGCNLGNWLMLEAWMLRWDIEDQQTIVQTFTDRFGPDASQRLMDTYREGYIRPRDFELIKSFGFNVVR